MSIGSWVPQKKPQRFRGAGTKPGCISDSIWEPESDERIDSLADLRNQRLWGWEPEICTRWISLFWAVHCRKHWPRPSEFPHQPSCPGVTLRLGPTAVMLSETWAPPPPNLCEAPNTHLSGSGPQGSQPPGCSPSSSLKQEPLGISSDLLSQWRESRTWINAIVKAIFLRPGS